MSYDNWLKTTVDEISLKVFSGGTPSTKNQEFWNGNLPWLSSGETRNNFITDTEKTITEKGVARSSTRLAEVGDIVIASAGQGFTRGQTSFCKIDTYINQSIVAIRCDSEKAHNMFVYYNIKNRYNELRGISDGHSIRGSLTTKLIKGLDIVLPIIEKQKAIANILSSLDDKIELNNRINKNLEELAQTIYKRWFVDFDFPNEDGEPYKSSGGQMIESELGLIPNNWEIIKIKDICLNDIAICGKTPSTKNKKYYGIDIPFIKIPDMHNKIFVVQTNVKLSYLGKESQKNKTLPKNSICISCIGTPGLVVLTTRESQTNQQINSIIPKYIELLYYTFLNLKLRGEEIKALGSAGTTLYNLNKANFEKIDIILPPKRVLSRFHKIMESNFTKLLNNYYQNELLSKTRDTLLPKLMSGEIEVPIEINKVVI